MKLERAIEVLKAREQSHRRLSWKQHYCVSESRKEFRVEDSRRFGGVGVEFTGLHACRVSFFFVGGGDFVWERLVFF